jgi:nitrogen regulatory protein PII
MKLVVIILNKIEYLEDIIYGLVEIGVSGATVYDSTGMGHILSDKTPIFAGLKDAFPGSSPTNKTIYAVVKEDMVNDIASILEDVCGSFNQPGTGIMFTLPVEDVWGFNPGMK